MCWVLENECVDRVDDVLCTITDPLEHFLSLPCMTTRTQTKIQTYATHINAKSPVAVGDRNRFIQQAIDRL
jgi:hypothetical protein